MVTWREEDSGLKRKQQQVICQMLSASFDPEAQSSQHRIAGGNPRYLVGGDDVLYWSDEWKVLVYDNHCRDIISTLLNVSQLRKMGVTLHLLLHSERCPDGRIVVLSYSNHSRLGHILMKEQIPDVPAVYFCEPTLDNVKRIAKDCVDRLYKVMHVNFPSKIERPVLEGMAKYAAVVSGGGAIIQRVMDQFVNFVSLENHLFTLGMTRSFLAYNDPSVTDNAISEYIKSLTQGLLSVLSTLKGVPIIRAAPGGPGQMVAEQLNQVIADYIAGGGGIFATGGSRSSVSSTFRPLLVILDRTADLVTPLRHTSTYQALIDDVLDHRLNRVTIEIKGGQQQTGQANKRRTYDVNPETDAFYAKHKGIPFPEAIEANRVDLASTTQREEEIRKMTQAAGIKEDTTQTAGGAIAAAVAAEGGRGKTQGLTVAVESLPVLLEQKKTLEMHTNILKATMDAVAERQVPLFFEAEQEAISGARGARATIEDLLTSGKASLQDEIRLLGVYCLATRPTPKVFAQLEGKLREARIHSSTKGQQNDNPDLQQLEAGLKAVKYLQKQVALQNLPTTTGMDVPSSTPSPGAGNKSKFMQGLLAKAQTQATGLLTTATTIAGQLLSNNTNTYITRLVQSLLEHGEGDDAYLYLDPRLKGTKMDPSNSSLGRQTSQDIIVFMIGGGNYAEFQNLQDYAAKLSASGKPVNITYGCTELLNAEELLEQVQRLRDRLKAKQAENEAENDQISANSEANANAAAEAIKRITLEEEQKINKGGATADALRAASLVAGAKVIPDSGAEMMSEEKRHLNAAIGTGKEQNVRLWNTANNQELIIDSSVVSNEEGAKACFAFTGCTGCKYTIKSFCAKVFIRHCFDCEFIFDEAARVLTQTLEVERCQRTILRVQSRICTAQVEQCSSTIVDFIQRDKFGNGSLKQGNVEFGHDGMLIWAGCDDLRLRVGTDTIVCDYALEAKMDSGINRDRTQFKREEDEFDRRENESIQKLASMAGISIRRKQESIGTRVKMNDPCPCKSGKKYKKCCYT